MFIALLAVPATHSDRLKLKILIDRGAEAQGPPCSVSATNSFIERVNERRLLSS